MRKDKKTRLWEIPVNFARDYGLQKGDLVELRCGSLSAKAVITVSSRKNFGLSSDLLNKLSLPEHLKLGLKTEGAKRFRLGPVIGILTFTHVIEKRDFSRYIPYAMKMKNTGILYVFGPKSINSDLKIINGYFYDERRTRWRKRDFPFPDVVMDRIYPTNFTNHLILEKAMGPNRIFNKNTLINKMQFFETLSRDHLLSNHIPETKPLGRVEDIEYMLTKYQGVMLKPVDGMKGSGIIEVIKSKQGLTCRHMGREGQETISINDAAEILKLLDNLGQRKRPYIIQAVIHRMKYNKQPFEFRVMTVKNGNDEWAVPAIFTKIADPEQFLTNISAGANMIFFQDLLDGLGEKLPYSKKEFVNLLSSLSIKTASVLEKSYGPLGKLGLDIIVGDSGKPWLIEANGNPGLMLRKSLQEYPEWRSEMYDYPLSYCLFLSGFSHLNSPLMSLKSGNSLPI